MWAATPTGSATRPPKAETKRKPTKLGFKAVRELDEAPARIEALETEQRELADRLNQPAFHKSDAVDQARVYSRLEAITNELEVAYNRWTELEALRDGL